VRCSIGFGIDRISPPENRAGTDTGLLPPCGFIATAMDVAMMATGHGELIADLAADRAMLRETQMMGICGPAAANQTRLFWLRI
jgi:hypothetical protein